MSDNANKTDTTNTTINAVTKTITIHAPSSRVWEALTRPELMKLWMAETDIEIMSNWTVGSPIVMRLKMHDKIFVENKGTILRFEPEKVFQYTYWNRLSRLPDAPENYSVIEFRLRALSVPDQGDQTMLDVTHSNLGLDATAKHASFYWNATLDIMKRLLEKQAAADAPG